MPLKKKLHVVIVLDESGSMQTIQDKTISGYNEYVTSMYPDGNATHLTLVKFSSRGTETVYGDIPVKDGAKLGHGNYTPNGNTPLFDAVGNTITAIDEKQKTSQAGQDILFVVITDGEENSSVQYTRQQIATMIADKEKSGWTFAYLGANQDSWANANSMGYSHMNNTQGFVATPAGMGNAFGSLTNSTRVYCRARQSHYDAGMASGLSEDKIQAYSTADFFSPGTADDATVSSNTADAAAPSSSGVDTKFTFTARKEKKDAKSK